MEYDLEDRWEGSEDKGEVLENATLSAENTAEDDREAASMAAAAFVGDDC